MREFLYVSAVEKPERLALWVAILLAAPSCGPKKRDREPVLAASARDLAPEASPGEGANLRLGGKEGVAFEVALRQSRKGETVAYELLTGGETLEREAYRAGDGAFAVVRAGDDAFDPPIDLLRYPVRAGDAWTWKGKVAYAGASRDAHADVSIGRDGEETRSEVTLFVAADVGRPELQRGLRFWFRKGKGVARRSFGDVSARFPQGETWPP